MLPSLIFIVWLRRISYLFKTIQRYSSPEALADKCHKYSRDLNVRTRERLSFPWRKSSVNIVLMKFLFEQLTRLMTVILLHHTPSQVHHWQTDKQHSDRSGQESPVTGDDCITIHFYSRWYSSVLPMCHCWGEAIFILLLTSYFRVTIPSPVILESR